MREGFQQVLEGLTEEVLGISRIVGAQVRGAVKAVIEDDTEAAAAIIAADDEVDDRCLGAEDRIIEITATQHPVARDLRLLWSLNHVLTHLERMGDLATNIAKVVRRSEGRRASQTLYDLLQAQGNLVVRLLEASMEALEKGDLELAKRLPEMDEPIDHLHKQFFREMSRVHDEGDAEVASMLVLASRHLERVADNAVDIGERVSYLLTGHHRRTDEAG
ncbi:MAG: phosphate signaling complex protein PhoU [Actinobacteria bacterium]|nr:MAG: phosphate signaling complex protein PhoU [Actinomycetota bacterium]